MGQNIAIILSVLKGYLCLKDGMNYFFMSWYKKKPLCGCLGNK